MGPHLRSKCNLLLFRQALLPTELSRQKAVPAKSAGTNEVHQEGLGQRLLRKRNIVCVGHALSPLSYRCIGGPSGIRILVERLKVSYPYPLDEWAVISAADWG